MIITNYYNNTRRKIFLFLPGLLRDVFQRWLTNVSEQQTVALKDASVFSVELDESVYINDIPRLAIIARYSNTEVRGELCC